MKVEFTDNMFCFFFSGRLSVCLLLWLDGCLFIRLVGLLVGVLVFSRWVCSLVDWLVDCLVCWLLVGGFIC